MALTADEAAATTGPDTIDCIAPAQGWQAHWQQAVTARRAAVPWLAAAAAVPTQRMSLAQRCGVQDAARQEACEACCAACAKPAFSKCACPGPTCTAPSVARPWYVTAACRPWPTRCKAGIGMVGTVLLKDTSDRTAFKVFEPGAMAQGLEGFAAAANVHLLPDPASFTLLPWAPGTAWLRAEPFWHDGSPVAVDPRRVLQRALAALAARGLALVCGLEIEFHIYRITHDRAGARRLRLARRAPRVADHPPRLPPAV
jgi:hypothetical protein